MDGRKVAVGALSFGGKVASSRPQQGARRLATLPVSDVTNAIEHNMLRVAAIRTPKEPGPSL
jgi:hypothetical protein